MSTLYSPATEQELAGIVAEARDKAVGLDIAGGATKSNIGRPTNSTARITLRTMSGITLYEPNEMVMSARAGTPLTEIRAALAKGRQTMVFEPSELAGLVGGDPFRATIGAVFSTNASGPRRISAGAARDHLVGVRAVNGRGEIYKNGGRVMKNVTGYDIARGLAGSWGTLSVLTEVTFKVMPLPEASTTLILLGLPDEIGVEVLTTAIGTPFEISAAAHIPEKVAARLAHETVRSQGKSVTALRIEASPKSLAYRKGRLADALKAYGALHDLDQMSSEAFWNEIRDVRPFANSDRPLWRISTAPTKGPALVASLTRYMDAAAFYDWSGGLVWLEVPETTDAGAADVRRVVASHGGHATLIRASQAARAATDVFQPPEPSVLALSQKLKAAFDPANILNPGRMYLAF